VKNLLTNKKKERALKKGRRKYALRFVVRELGAKRIRGKLDIPVAKAFCVLLLNGRLPKKLHLKMSGEGKERTLVLEINYVIK
jgi:hypothetical protein